MRIESQVMSVSWIPSAAISGTTKMPFEMGVTHYDDPPPERIDDLDAVVGPDGARFANELRAWIEVEDGQVVGYGQSGAGRVSDTKMRVAGITMIVAATTFPDLHPEPEVGDDYVRFVQTAGGRPGLLAPRRVKGAPFVKIEGPNVWTTLALTIRADGTSSGELIGATTFPRHWVYDATGKLASKSATIDFKTWYAAAHGKHSPWGDEEVVPKMSDAETALERRLSRTVMGGGSVPKPKRVGKGKMLISQDDEDDDLVLLLDGVVEICVDDEPLGVLGPGSILGERASLEGGKRTASARTLTDCRVVRFAPASIAVDDLVELSEGHRREDGERRQ